MNGDQIVQLLTEIRDGHREERDWRHQIAEKSLRFQRRLYWMHLFSTGIVLLFLALMVTSVFWAVLF